MAGTWAARAKSRTDANGSFPKASTIASSDSPRFGVGLSPGRRSVETERLGLQRQRVTEAYGLASPMRMAQRSLLNSTAPIPFRPKKQHNGLLVHLTGVAAGGMKSGLVCRCVLMKECVILMICANLVGNAVWSYWIDRKRGRVAKAHPPLEGPREGSGKSLPMMQLICFLSRIRHILATPQESTGCVQYELCTGSLILGRRSGRGRFRSEDMADASSATTNGVPHATTCDIALPSGSVD
jgi:hypothetical protein